MINIKDINLSIQEFYTFQKKSQNSFNIIKLIFFYY